MRIFKDEVVGDTDARAAKRKGELLAAVQGNLLIGVGFLQVISKSLNLRSVRVAFARRTRGNTRLEVV